MIQLEVVTKAYQMSKVEVRALDGVDLTIDDGEMVAIMLRPLLAAHDPPAPLALRQALRVINHHVEDYIPKPVWPLTCTYLANCSSRG